MGVALTGYIIRLCLAHRNRVNVEPSGVRFLETKTPEVVARRELTEGSGEYEREPEGSGEVCCEIAPLSAPRAGLSLILACRC
jgi:hypothetical protein